MVGGNDEMEVNKLIGALNGMILSAGNEPKIDEWVKEFLIEVKSTLEAQQKEIKKIERYEKALLEIVENPKDWSKSYGNAYTESVRIALKALQINE